MVRRITTQQLLEITRKAAEKVIVSALVLATPGRGIVADEWEAVIEKDTVKVQNAKYGDVIRFLDQGTKGPYIIKPKVERPVRWKGPVKSHRKGAWKVGRMYRKMLRWKSGSGDTFTYRRRVKHPGIEARKIVTNTLTPKLMAKFMREWTKMLKQAVF